MIPAFSTPHQNFRPFLWNFDISVVMSLDCFPPCALSNDVFAIFCLAFWGMVQIWMHSVEDWGQIPICFFGAIKDRENIESQNNRWIMWNGICLRISQIALESNCNGEANNVCYSLTATRASILDHSAYTKSRCSKERHVVENHLNDFNCQTTFELRSNCNTILSPITNLQYSTVPP